MGSLDYLFNPVSLALGAEATFVARTMDSDRKHLTSVLRASAAHRGTALVEIYQNCNIYNDGAFDLLKDPGTRDDWTIRLEHGEPIRFGRDGANAIVRDPASGGLRVAENVPEGDPSIVVHDAHAPDPSYAFALSRLAGTDLRYTPMGVFRSVERPSYDELMSDQLAHAQEKGAGDLAALLHGPDTWTIN
jgi:2-oxoglutarate ferredoxin oxidoreductase subunit beta